MVCVIFDWSLCGAPPPGFTKLGAFPWLLEWVKSEEDLKKVSQMESKCPLIWRKNVQEYTSTYPRARDTLNGRHFRLQVEALGNFAKTF